MNAPNMHCEPQEATWAHQYRITLRQDPGGFWCAWYAGDHRETREVVALMGGPCLPTPFPNEVPVDSVLGVVRTLNPDALVEVAP